MNETYGMSTSEEISQANSVSNYHPDLSRAIILSQLIPGYASLEILSRAQHILGCPNL